MSPAPQQQLPSADARSKGLGSCLAFATDSLCDFGQILQPSESQFPHVQNKGCGPCNPRVPILRWGCPLMATPFKAFVCPVGELPCGWMDGLSSERPLGTEHLGLGFHCPSSPPPSKSTSLGPWVKSSTLCASFSFVSWDPEMTGVKMPLKERVLCQV